MNLTTKINFWWYNYIYFPLWYRFGSQESHDEITKSLKKRRQEGGCSMWQECLKRHPEDAKYKWEKNFVKKIKQVDS